MIQPTSYPRLHNAMWPGLVGKGPDSEPPIDLHTMIELTAAARVDGQRFDGIDLFLAEPHVSIDADENELQALVDTVQQHDLVIGSCVAPVWAATGGGSAMGTREERAAFLSSVARACRIGQRLTELGVRTADVIRIDSSCSVSDWLSDPAGNTRRIAETFGEACDIAADHGQRLAAEGEICWGGMHSWRAMLDTLEAVNRPEVLGFQADMAHTLLYCLGENAPEHRLLAEGATVHDRAALQEALRELTEHLRPSTIDFHVAQNDATVKGMGSHDRTGHHCLPDDPAGVLDIAHDAGYWLRDADGTLTRRCRHLCWDGCLFPNEAMLDPHTWERVLGVMLDVRHQHGWQE